MDKPKYIYAAGAMGFYGEGHWFHNFFNFPYYPFVTKTLTYNKKRGYPYAVIPFFNTVWNKVSLDNPGLYDWVKNIPEKLSNKPSYNTDFLENTISIYPEDELQLFGMILCLRERLGAFNLEINLSCPNVKISNFSSCILNSMKLYDGVNVWLKLNYKQNPLQFDLSKIKGIRLNSIPTKFGGLSGRYARDKNWEFIEKYNKHIPVSGCSWSTKNDIDTLISMGCKEISIGSVIITNPKLVENLPCL